MECTEYRPGGAFLRTGTDVARQACAIDGGTWSDGGCPTAGSPGQCEDADFTLVYHVGPGERLSVDELRRGCETPSRVGGRRGTFRPAPGAAAGAKP